MGAGRNWTKEEELQLAEDWGKVSIPTIAANLNRTVAAIKVRAHLLHLGAHLDSSHRISFNVFIDALGYHGGYEGYLKKFTEAGLKIYSHRVEKDTFRMVDLDEFWKWAEKNKHLIDFSRLEKNLLGAEPEWVKVKRTEDYNRNRAIKPHHAVWTEAEDKELLRLLRRYQYTYPEISQMLRRSEGAIQRRVLDLGIKERPLKASPHNPWSEEQIQTLCRMIKAGSNYESMSLAIGKSTKAIRGKVFTTYLTENLNRAAALLGDGEWGNNRPERRVGQKLLMNQEEKAELKQEMGKLVSLLTYSIRKQFNDQDNWQRNLCHHWHKVKGCSVGETDCDTCTQFQRIRPQYCVRCGATFYERAENRRCARCRQERKKAAYRKYLKTHKL